MAKKLKHPGTVLKTEMDRRDLSCRKVAEAINVPPRRVIDIVNGNLRITADSALRLGRLFNTGPEKWVALQREYDLAKASKKLGAKLLKIAPMAKAA